MKVEFGIYHLRTYDIKSVKIDEVTFYKEGDIGRTFLMSDEEKDDEVSPWWAVYVYDKEGHAQVVADLPDQDSALALQNIINELIKANQKYETKTFLQRSI